MDDGDPSSAACSNLSNFQRWFDTGHRAQTKPLSEAIIAFLGHLKFPCHRGVVLLAIHPRQTGKRLSVNQWTGYRVRREKNISSLWQNISVSLPHGVDNRVPYLKRRLYKIQSWRIKAAGQRHQTTKLSSHRLVTQQKPRAAGRLREPLIIIVLRAA